MDVNALLRGGALALLALLSALSWRAGGAQRLLALSCGSGCAFLIVSYPPIFHGAARWVLAAIAATGPFWFMVATRRLFGAPAKLKLGELAGIAIALAAVAVAPNFAAGGARFVLSLAVDMVLLSLFVAALYVAWRGLADDLDPQRRSLRLILLGASSGFCVLVAGGALWANAARVEPATLNTAIYAGALVVTWAYCYWTVRLGVATPPPRPAGKPDTILTQRIVATFETEKLHRRPDLTLSVLAQTLQAPEHQVRTAINADLGARNFSAFVNGYRLAEVKQALADPTQSDVPIATIALDAGFGSIPSFNRIFKAELGVSPSEFRRTAET